jgi:23S rRNA pseudouridine2604 synthase
LNRSNENSTSLNKYISETGICSRREADRYIEQDRVTLNGKRTKPGNRVYPGDTVKVDGKAIRKDVNPIYLALNKPTGIVCTTDQNQQDNIITYLKYPQRLFPIGRLDKPSEGLIFLTNDGDIVNKILRAGNEHEKEYVVTVDKKITDDFITKMASGIKILGTKTKPCKVIKIKDKTFEITLTQGLNRQIRRMCEKLEYDVLQLKRTRIMNVSLKGINTGQWRELTKEELAGIFEMVASSSKTQHPDQEGSTAKAPAKDKKKSKVNSSANSSFTKKGYKHKKPEPPKPTSQKRIGKSKPSKSKLGKKR